MKPAILIQIKGKQKLKRNSVYSAKGITLIALIVTIIVLIILAGTSISLLLGENGIVTKAKQAKEKQEITQIMESLELEKLNKITKLKGDKLTLENYLEHIKTVGIIKNENIRDGENTLSKEIFVDNYIFLIRDLQNGNIQIEYIGMVGKLLPKIKKIELTATTSTILAKVTATNVDNGEYRYYIKDVTDNETYDLKEVTQNSEYKFINLKHNNIYQIKVEITNSSGTVEQETENIETTVFIANAFSGSDSGCSSSTSTHEDKLLYPTINDERLNEVINYSNGKFTVLKDCTINFKGYISATTANTAIIFGYYKNQSKPSGASTPTTIQGVNVSSTEFTNVVSFSAGDYFYLVWKALHNYAGNAGSSYQGEVSFSADIDS